MSALNETHVEQQLEAAFERGPVVVWHDAAGEFAGEVAGFAERAGADLAPVDALFALVCRINTFERDGRLLVYRRHDENGPAVDWLADVELYAEAFSADATSLALGELGVADTPGTRRAAARYRSFLSKPTYLGRVRALVEGRSVATEQELDVAVMLAALNAAGPLAPTEAAAAYLSARDEAAALGALERAGAGGRFSALVEMLGGVSGGEGAAPAMGEVAACVLAGAYRHATGVALRDEAPSGRPDLCYEALCRWRELAARPQVGAVCEAVSCRPGMEARLNAADIDELMRQDVFPMAEERIAGFALEAAASSARAERDVHTTIDARKRSYWWEEYRAYYEVAAYVARMRSFYETHAEGFVSPARELWDAYVRELYEMDALYRKLRAVARPCEVYAKGNLDEPLRAALDYAERLYNGWFLRELGQAWDDASAVHWAEHGCVPGIKRTDGFYAIYAKGLRGKSACASVIISDALRYEVAAELAERLRQETHGTVELGAQLALFPSITPLGMASLLPHRDLRLQDDCGDVLVDGSSSAGLERRQALLRGEGCLGDPRAVTVSATDLSRMPARDRRDLGRGAGLVYVYHNAIDAAGEQNDADLPEACARAVGELVDLVRACANAFGPNVIVTADHGFVYTAKVPGPSDLAQTAEIEGEVLCATHRRAVLADASATSTTFLPVSLGPAGRGDLSGWVPRGYARVSQPGAGSRFVHGGTSLQEVCVPVLRYRAMCVRARGYRETADASVSLLSPSRLVTSWKSVMAFHQDEAVGGGVLPCVYKACLENASGGPASDVAEVHADRRSVDGEAGTIRVPLSVLPGLYVQGETYFLVLRRATSGEVVLRERFDIQLSCDEQMPGTW